jgi:hypothetical protein
VLHERFSVPRRERRHLVRDWIPLELEEGREVSLGHISERDDLARRHEVGQYRRRSTRMTNKTDYTDDEWTVLLRAPMVAAMVISFADPGGPIELTKEVLAAQRTLSAPESTEELLVAVSQDAMAHAQHRENVMSGFKTKGAMAGQLALPSKDATVPSIRLSDAQRQPR